MPANIRTGQDFHRTVVDVATEEQCPHRDPGLPHEIRPIYPLGANPRTSEQVWACVHCRVPWADLDEQANSHLRRRTK